MKRIRQRLTYANVMSTIAVFLLLGGATALAAHHLGKNSVGARQLKPKAVTTKKIRKKAVTKGKLAKNAVTGAKVRNGSLTGADINLGTLGTVPSAANAVNAATAVNAQQVDGQTVTKVFRTLLPGETNITVATIAGFTLAASCAFNDVDLSLASPTSPASVISAQGNGELAHQYFVYDSKQNGTSSRVELDGEKGANAFGEVSFSGALENGTVISGNLGYDYETFGGTSPHRCSVFGDVISG